MSDRPKRMSTTMSLAVLAAFLIGSGCAIAGMWTTIDYPGAYTEASGIDGDNVVGSYLTGGTYSSVSHGFRYDGTNWTTFDAPESSQTYAWGISGSRIVGYYRDTTSPLVQYTSFLRDGANSTVIYAPDSINTYAFGIEGTRVVGNYSTWSDAKTHGFLYDSAADKWTMFNHPSAVDFTSAQGIQGGTIVGWAVAGTTSGLPYNFGFLYDGTNWTNLQFPAAEVTKAYGISGDNVVGYYREKTSSSLDHGFIYNMTQASWTAFDFPGALHTEAYGISGDKIVGQYTDADYVVHGFVYTVPEPATVLLFALGAAAVRGRRRCQP